MWLKRKVFLVSVFGELHGCRTGEPAQAGEPAPLRTVRMATGCVIRASLRECHSRAEFHSAPLGQRGTQGLRIHAHEFLDAFSVFHFARVDVALGIRADCIDPVQISCIAAGAAEGAYQLSGLSLMNPHRVIGTVRDEQILLLGVGGKRHVEHGAAGTTLSERAAAIWS